MRKLREIWEKLQGRLRGQEEALKFAQKKHHNWRIRAELAHDRELGLRKGAEKALKFGDAENQAKGERLLRKAGRTHNRWERRHKRVLYWKGRVKRCHIRIHHLHESVEKIEAAQEKFRKEHGVYQVSENKVRGGTPGQRKVYAANRAMLNYQRGDQPGYYSQEGGSRDYPHGLKGYPHGLIWDCSTFADAVHYVCGIESPSGHEYAQGGFTGTEMLYSTPIAHGHQEPGDLVIYQSFKGDTTGHHVEVLVALNNSYPGGGITVGHGDSAINNGVVDNFGDGLYVFRRMNKPCPSLN